MALTSRRRLCLLDMASSLIVIPSADCPLHNVPIVTLCMKQITLLALWILSKRGAWLEARPWQGETRRCALLAALERRQVATEQRKAPRKRG
jgi:hypothetical protein